MAGKAKRKAAREKRRQKKKARKLAQKDQYQQWMREGRNTKSKRVKLRAQRLRKSTIRLKRHASGPCGNIGCRTCNPIPQNLHTPSQGQHLVH
jgi:hypothetical protein